MTRPGVTLALSALVLASLVAAPIAVAFGASGYLLVVATRGAVLAIAAISLQFVVGFAGLFSLGQAAVVGIGAYVVLAAEGADAAVVLPAAMISAALFAGLTGVVALRTQGVTYIMITLAFGQLAYFVAQAWAPLGGDDGMPLDGRSPVFGNGWIATRAGLHLAVIVSLVVWGLLLRALALSRFGRALRASSGNADRAAALGFDVMQLRLCASAVAGAGGGLAGFWLANSSLFVSPAIIDWRASGHLLVMVILGSRLAIPLGDTVEARLLGAAVGALGLVAAEEGLALFTGHGAIIVGALLVAAAVHGTGAGGAGRLAQGVR